MKSGMRPVTQVLLLVIALKTAAMPAQAGTSSVLQSYEGFRIEECAVVLSIIIGLFIAQRWILPSDIYPWQQLSKRFGWNMLGLLIALASGGIGLLVVRAVKALIG